MSFISKMVRIVRNVTASSGTKGPKNPGARKSSARRYPKGSFNHTSRAGRSHSPLRRGEIIAYHGTPKINNVQSILKDGFMVTGANGNALGDGIYLTSSLSTARGYAGSSGVYLKCRVRLGKSCQWNEKINKRFSAWCQRKGVSQDNSARTGFLLQHGFHTLQSGNVIVVLMPRYSNPTAYKYRHPRIRVLGVHRASDGHPIRSYYGGK